MDVHPSNAAANSLDELFPHQAALENDGSPLDCLSVYVEDCFSSSSSFANPVLGKPAPTMANQGAGNPKLLSPPASNGRQSKRNLDDDDDRQYIFPLFVEPPLLMIDQKPWMAESELILPKKEKDQELSHQQEQEYKEEKCEEDALTQFNQELLLKRCSNCSSYQTPLWRHGPSGHKMLCNACDLEVKKENRFTTISGGKQFGQGTKKKQEQGKWRYKKIKKTVNDSKSELLALEPPARVCTHCMTSKTPQWRAGPKGPKTLCNACGVRFKSGRLLPEYRPASSPTFVSHIHSNSHKKVLQLRQEK